MEWSSCKIWESIVARVILDSILSCRKKLAFMIFSGSHAPVLSYVTVLLELLIAFFFDNNWQLKEMVLALLTESELTLSDDTVEAIVDKVRNFFLFC